MPSEKQFNSLEKRFKENYLQVKVLRQLDKIPKLWHVKISDRFKSGIPDLLICHKGKFIAIELKREGEKATRLQNNVMAKIWKAGGTAYECHSVEEVLTCLK